MLLYCFTQIVRWLSKVIMLKRLHELKEVVVISRFQEEKFVGKVLMPRLSTITGLSCRTISGVECSQS